MINFLKPMTTPGGIAVEFHRMVRAELSPDGLHLNVIGHSWPTSLQYEEGREPVERWACQIPCAALVGDALSLTDTIGVWMVTQGPLQGGSVLPAGVQSLNDAKLMKWAQCKVWRDQVEYGGFEWDYSRFDSDPTSRSRIQGVVQLASLALGAGQEFVIDWTLEDNSVRTLTGPDCLALGLALGAHVQAAFVIALELRTAIEQAVAVEQLDALTWEDRILPPPPENGEQGGSSDPPLPPPPLNW